MKKLYFFTERTSGKIIAVRHGETGYHVTDVDSQEEADGLNEKQGIIAADCKAAEFCSIVDRWDCFEEFKADVLEGKVLKEEA